jgi:hypothetical protein
MSEQVKRSPGRPKKQVDTKPVAKEVEAATATAKKIKTVQKKQKAPSHRLYEIVSGGGVVYMLPSKGITIYDEERGQVREMRYCENEPSIWVDSQSDNALRRPVMFREGKLLVPKERPNLMEFLDRHPYNVANGGGVFTLVDTEKDAAVEIEKEFNIAEAISMVRDKEIVDLLPVALFFNIDVDRPTSEIRFDLLKEAKSNPTKFVEAFDNPMVRARSVVKQAADYQIINLKTDGCYWFDSNRLIVAVPAGHTALEVMTRFCMTEKGAAVFATLEESLEKLS